MNHKTPENQLEILNKNLYEFICNNADNNNMNDSEHDAFNFAIILILLCLQQINKCMYVS